MKQKMKISAIIILVCTTAFSFSSCKKITEGATVEMRNTLQDPGEAEVTYASLFGKADDAFDETGTISKDEVEFPTALAQDSTATGAPFNINGLYSIDLSAKQVTFTVLPTAEDPFWSGVFGEFPEGKFDRYYFTFSEEHKISGFSSDQSWVNLRIDSPTVIVMELSAGYNLQPGVSFIVDFE